VQRDLVRDVARLLVRRVDAVSSTSTAIVPRSFWL